MSFNVNVAIKLGTATVTTSGDVPDGEFVIAGHEDSGQRFLSVSRRGPDGRFVQVAQATHYKEQ